MDCAIALPPPDEAAAILAAGPFRAAAVLTLSQACRLADPVSGRSPLAISGRADTPILPGRVERRVLADTGVPYVVYVPSRTGADAPVLVSVHGISRNALEQVSMFAPFAERAGVVVVAPLFECERFPQYQRLTRNERGESPVAFMEAIVAEVARATGAGAERLYLFGYSGGGQFVHRYAMAHPERVARYVVGAAGWYTFPDAARRYPYGLRHNRRIGMGGFDPRRFLAVPGWVLVGERDVHEGTAMRKTERVMLEQGASRMERGRRWVEAMNARAAELGLEGPVGFEILRRSPHSFGRSMRRGELGERVFGHLFGPPGGGRGSSGEGKTR